ncbi:hypothetical protein [Microbulbifer marinus]|uniref:Uncharacterized protein n=1 Tax=Microbulbifer marinus TaxID=658218 RepID=A0A1H3Z4N0_9GAMM|nr:hypothetical protein [Microbulbifer marinus]SEA18617.1 hypothetical protein SAMN05216562_2186 [Microbulbifer marinus]
MSFLLRKISKSKWESNLDKQPDDFSADAITGCTRTNKNTLSVWKSTTANFESDECKELVVAVATTMDRPDAIDLLWLEQDWLQEKGIAIVETPGNSKYSAMNSRHRDLSNLNHRKLALVGEHIVSRLNSFGASKRVLRPELIKLVAERYKKGGTFELGDLSPKWQEAVSKHIERTN